MIRLKSMLNNINAKNKSLLTDIYISRGEGAQIYQYKDIKFYFYCPSMRSIEKSIMYIMIPSSYFPKCRQELRIALEDYILRTLSPQINALSDSYQNIKKDKLEKAEIRTQVCNEIITHRNGIIYNPEKQVFNLCVRCRFPLNNNTWINSKGILRMLRDLLKLITDYLKDFNVELCEKHIDSFYKQQQIRTYLNMHNLIAFIADGSVIPRQDGTSYPMQNAIPFESPSSFKETITFSDGTDISGMAVHRGVTIITEGGYSGKSTLLDGIERGIYNHIPDDGREFVITDETALKIYAEDGRPVHNIDITPFFKFLPGNNDPSAFSTFHASGSVSQAANIIEAVCCGSKVLLIDEDKSATNFMIRDKNMRKIIKKESIIPFTDRVRELYLDKGISTILVIGGSSEYLGYADSVILMDDYAAKDITDEINKELDIPPAISEEKKADWMKHRYLMSKETTQPFIYFTSINTENLKKIIIDEYSADITMLTAIISQNQLNYLAYMMKQLIMDKESGRADLSEIIRGIIDRMYSTEINEEVFAASNKIDNWFETVRPIDVYCCANRMRGLQFRNDLEAANEENKMFL